MLIDTNGNPTQGSAQMVGATQGAMTVSIGPALEKIMADQVAAPIDIVMTGEAESIEVEMKQSDLANREALSPVLRRCQGWAPGPRSTASHRR